MLRFLDFFLSPPGGILYLLSAKKTLGYINIIYCDQSSKVAFFRRFSLAISIAIVTQATVIVLWLWQQVVLSAAAQRSFNTGVAV